MLNLIKGDVVVLDGYDGDNEPRACVVDKPIWESKAGEHLLTVRDIARNVFRSYKVAKIQNLRRSKT